MAKKMVALKLPRYQHDKRDSRYQQLNYSQAAPFFANPSGVLVHRVAPGRYGGTRRRPGWASMARRK